MANRIKKTAPVTPSVPVAPVAPVPAPVVPVAPVVPAAPIPPLDACKAQFIGALTGALTAKDALSAAFIMTRGALIGNSVSLESKTKLRNTLIEWAGTASVNLKTAKNLIASLMKDAGLSLRNRPKTGLTGTEDEVELANALIEQAGDQAGEGVDLVKVFRLALDIARSDAKDAQAATTPAAEVKVA